MSRFMRFSRGKIWFVDIGPCKRFDILLICSISYSMVPTLLVAVSILLVSAFLALLLGTLIGWRSVRSRVSMTGP